jgi:two-component system, chemotaxis family, sensor kinase CheA
MGRLTGDDLRALFVQEAQVRLAQLSQLLLQLEQRGDDQDLIRSVYRELHTLKGSSAVAGLEDVSACAHALEELIDPLTAGRQTATPALVDALLAGTDELGSLIVGANRQPSGSEREAATCATPGPSTPPASASGTTTAAATDRGTPGAVIMVPTERLEDLTRLVGEAAAAHLRIGRMLTDRFQIDPASCTEFNELARSLNDLQDRAMRTQMVPVATVTDQLQRAVRDLSRLQGKQVRWEVRGTDTELDRGMLHRLSDSLLHLVRNAVDHGIELPAERKAAGKPATGTIRLHAMQLGSEVIITVTDDGRGVDVDAVLAEAARRGIDAEDLTDEERLGLAFRPGLSTASFVTDVSGRGVGLDVVRTNVEAVRGRVEVRSTPGAGAEFRIIVPITLAVLRCLMIQAGGQRFALPFHRVVLTLDPGSAVHGHAEGRPIVCIDGSPIPLSALDAALGIGSDEAALGPIVVLADTSRRHAFRVETLIGQRDVVLKGLSRLVPHLPAVAGASVEPDGSILLVLDPPGLIERARRTGRSGAVNPTPPADTDRVRQRLLVVDDALTVRELQRSILQRAGFDVRVAADGSQALTILAEQPCDLVLTDIEMPLMDGFELTETIRAHPTLANLPVLILSSRSSEDDRQRGLSAGADGYIVKSGFDETSLLTAVNRLLGARK